MSLIEGAKVVGNVLRENKDTIAHVGKVGAEEVSKYKGKKNAKQCYADYLAFKSSGESDLEKFAYERSELTGRDWAEICENIRFHVQTKGGSLPTPATPVQTQLPESVPVAAIAETPKQESRLSAAEMVCSKEFMNAADMLEMFDSPHLTLTDIASMYQIISDELKRRKATEQYDWASLAMEFPQYIQTGGDFVQHFSRHKEVFARVYEVLSTPNVRADAVDLKTAWKSVEIVRFIHLRQNNGTHLSAEQWKQVHRETMVLLESRHATGDILGVMESLKDKWNMILSEQQDSLDLVSNEVGTMQEVYNYVQIPDYGKTAEEIAERLFDMFPAMESEDYRRLDADKAALLFAWNKVRELL